MPLYTTLSDIWHFTAARDEKYNQSGSPLGFEISTVELGTPVNPNETLKIEPVDTQAEFTKRPTFTKRAFTKWHLRNDIYETAHL